MNVKKFKHVVITIQLITLVLAFPAGAPAQAGSTNLTFIINAYSGGLAISVPTSETFTAITSPSTPTSVSLVLGDVSVTDTRRASTTFWSTSAVASNLLSATDTLTASSFGYNSGTHTITGTTASVQSVIRTSLDTPGEVERADSIVGNHIVTWTPTLTVPVPAFKNAGNYQGTITHSVS